MSSNETLIPIPGRLHSVAVEGNVVGANEVVDDTNYDVPKKQSDLNADFKKAIVHSTYIGEDNYVYAWNEGTRSYTKTSIYVRGEGFHVSKTFESVSDMEAYAGTDLKEGDFVLIQSNTEDPDNAKLYTFSGTQGVYNFLVDMSGAIGFTGKTPQFTIGTITTVEPNVPASASLTSDGTDSDGNPKYKLNLALPKGEKGTSDFVIVDDHSGAGDDPNKIYIPSANAEKENATAIANEVTRATEAEQTNATAIAAEEARARAAESDRYTKSETYTKTEVNDLVDTPHQEYVTVEAYSNLPATGSKDTIYRVSNYNGSTSQVDITSYSEYAWNGSSYTFLCVKSQIGEVFDISVYKNNTKYADLAAALNGGDNIPQSLQKGGMSVKFIQSSDNKYIQARCMAQNFTADITQWQSVDNVPENLSDNLVKSGGVKSSIVAINNPFLISGKAINASGNETAATGFRVTDFISIDSIDYIKGVVYDNSDSSNNRIGLVWYNANKEFISIYNKTGGSFYDDNPLFPILNIQKSSIPSNAAYFRCTGYNERTFIETGSLILYFNNILDTKAEDIFNSQSKMFERLLGNMAKHIQTDFDWIRGYINRSGVFVKGQSGSVRWTSPFIPYIKGTFIVTNNIACNAVVGYITQYNGRFEYISTIYPDNYDDSLDVYSEVVDASKFDSDTAYIRVSSLSEYSGGYVLVDKDDSLPIIVAPAREFPLIEDETYYLYGRNMLQKPQLTLEQAYIFPQTDVENFNRLSKIHFSTTGAKTLDFIYNNYKTKLLSQIKVNVLGKTINNGRAVRVLHVGDSFTDFSKGTLPVVYNGYMYYEHQKLAELGVTMITVGGRHNDWGVPYNCEAQGGYYARCYAARYWIAYLIKVPSNTNFAQNAKYLAEDGVTYTICSSYIINGEQWLRIYKEQLTFPATTLSSGTLTKVSGSGDDTITYSNAEKANNNPFWDEANNKLDFLYYARKVGYVDGDNVPNIDVLFLQFMHNDVKGWVGYDKGIYTNAEYTEQLDYLFTLIDTWNANMASVGKNTKIIVSIESLGMINVDNNLWMQYFEYIKRLYVRLRDYPNVIVMPVYPFLDAESSMPEKTVTPCSYYNKTEIVQYDGHPHLGWEQYGHFTAAAIYQAVRDLNS